MRLLAAQADALSAKADALEADVAGHASVLDAASASELFSRRGRELADLSARADALLSQTSREVVAGLRGAY
jgi:hypothetical protein